MDESEFGRGIVVCLVKYSEHINNEMMSSAVYTAQWLYMKDFEKAKIRAEAARYPHGDSARVLNKVNYACLGQKPSEGRAIHVLSMWANAASDHFYDLDRERAPASLIELADYALDLGHGAGLMGRWFDSATTTLEKLDRLWKRATLDVDRMLGIEPEWGTW